MKKIIELKPVSDKYFQRPKAKDAEIMVRMAIQYNDGRADGMVFRPVLIRGNDIKKKIDLGKGYSAMVMSDGVVIPIKVELTRLIDILDRNVGTNGYVDLSNLTGPAAEGAPDFSIVSKVLEKRDTPKEDTRLKVKLWIVDKSRNNSSYRQVTIYADDIKYVEPHCSFKEYGYMELKKPNPAFFSKSKDAAWFDMHVWEFNRAIDRAREKGQTHIDLSGQTGAHIQGKPERKFVSY